MEKEQIFLETLAQIFEREEQIIIPSSQIKGPSFFSKLKTDNYPSMVQVGITNVCDMSCSECYHRIYKKKSSYQPTFMDLEIFKRLLAKLRFSLVQQF